MARAACLAACAERADRLRSRALSREEESADVLPAQNRVEHARRAAVGDDGGPSSFVGDAHGFELGFHAAAAAAIAAAGVAADRDRSRASSSGIEASRPRGLRIAGVEAVHVGEQDQQIGVDVRHHQRGKLVVVAEDARRAAAGAPAGRSSSAVETVSFSLMMGMTPSRSSVVSVARRFSCRARIEEIVFGEQHLGDAEAQLLESIVVHAHQAALADGGAGLHQGELRKAARRVRAAARPSRPRRRRPARLRVRRGADWRATRRCRRGRRWRRAPSSRMITLVPTFTTMRAEAATCSRGESSVRWALPVSMAFPMAFLPTRLVLSRFLRGGTLMHSAARVANSALQADAIYRNQNRRLVILPARARGRKVGTMTVCEALMQMQVVIGS